MRMFHGNTADTLGESQLFLPSVGTRCLQPTRQWFVTGHGFIRPDRARKHQGFSRCKQIPCRP